MDQAAREWGGYHLAYRWRPQSPNDVGTLFGEITLQRCLYEPLEPGERFLFPLEITKRVR